MLRLILFALQVNAFGTTLPEPESNGTRYLGGFSIASIKF